MCRPIRNLTQMKGYDITSHLLSCFGGAGPQHACAVAKSLGMSKVLVHRYGGVLSAYGLSLSDAVAEVTEPANEVYLKGGGVEAAEEKNNREARFKQLVDRCKSDLKEQVRGWAPRAVCGNGPGLGPNASRRHTRAHLFFLTFQARSLPLRGRAGVRPLRCRGAQVPEPKVRGHRHRHLHRV